MTRQTMGRPARLTPNIAIRSMAHQWREVAAEPSEGSFQIFIRGMPTNQSQCFYVMPSTTVAALLQRIETQLGEQGHAELSRLQCQSRTLQPAQTMTEAGVQPGNTLELNCRLQSWTASAIGV